MTLENISCTDVGTVMMQSTAHPALSSAVLAVWYSSSLGSSSSHQEMWFTRYSAPLASSVRLFCLNCGSSGSRIPPLMPWLLAPKSPAILEVDNTLDLTRKLRDHTKIKQVLLVQTVIVPGIRLRRGGVKVLVFHGRSFFLYCGHGCCPV